MGRKSRKNEAAKVGNTCKVEGPKSPHSHLTSTHFSKKFHFLQTSIHLNPFELISTNVGRNFFRKFFPETFFFKEKNFEKKILKKSFENKNIFRKKINPLQLISTHFNPSYQNKTRFNPLYPTSTPFSHLPPYLPPKQTGPI